MGIIRGIKQSNSRIDKTLRMTGEGNSFLIGLDESSIASVARITADGGVVNCFQIFVSLTSKTTYCLLVTHSQVVISCFRIKKSRFNEAGFFYIATFFVFQKSSNCCTG